MDFWLAIVLLVALGCVTGVVITGIEKLSEYRRHSGERELGLVREQLRQREQRIAELEATNRQLERTLEWHMQLADSLGPGATGQLPAKAPVEDPARRS